MIGIPETLMVQQADGAAVTAAAATSLLLSQGKKTLPANFLNYIGQKLRIKASGKISSVITTPGTARFDFRLGGTVVFDGLAILLDTVAAHVNVGWSLEIDLTVRVVGSAGSFMGIGIWTCEDILGVPAAAPKGVLSAILPWNSAPAVGATVDMSTSLQADLQFTQTVATGSITLQQYELSAPNGY